MKLSPRRQIFRRDLQHKSFIDGAIGPSQPLAGEERRIIAILIPGIRTNGDWIDEADRHVQLFSIPIQVFKAYRDRVSSWHLVTRIGLGKIRREIRRQITRIISQNPGSEISLICHSMGTEILASIIDEFGDFHFSFIFFLGSVCHHDHIRAIERNCSIFVNHRGTFDYWPIIASIVRPYHYSATGTFGVPTTYGYDFIFNNDHFTSTGNAHISKYVLPVLITKTVPIRSEKIKTAFSVTGAHYWKRMIYACVGAGIILSILFRFLTNGPVPWFTPLALPPLAIAVCLVFYLWRRKRPEQNEDDQLQSTNRDSPEQADTRERPA